MNYVLSFIYDFVLLFLIFCFIHFLYYKRKKKSFSKLKKNDEVRLFVNRYGLDLKKTKYKTVLRVVAFNNSFIISFTATLILYINNYFLKILVSFIVVFILIYSLFELTGRYLKKKEDGTNV